METAEIVDLPWILAGDFNQVISSSEKLSKITATPGADQFLDVINSCNLIDMKAVGNWFTWHNGRQNGDEVWERLDRVLVNPDWFSFFHMSVVECLPMVASDHCPVFMSTERVL